MPVKMMHIRSAIFCTIISVLTFAVSETNFAADLPDGPYYGQTPPGLTAQVFAPGIISLTNRDELKIAWSPDGQECLIGIGNGLLYTKQVNGHWSDPTTPTFIGSLNLSEPYFSPDGQKIFYSNNSGDLWVSSRSNQTWTAPQKIASPIDTADYEWHPTITSDGTLYFCSSRNNPSGHYNIYRSKYVNGNYSTVEKLNSMINSSNGAWDPFIAPDESYMIFSSSGRPDGYGLEDQYISYRGTDDSWSAPKNLGPSVNSNQSEYGSYISPDNKYYFFSRPSGGGANSRDIYWVDARAIGVPEPDTLVLLALGGLCLLWRWPRNEVRRDRAKQPV